MKTTIPLVSLALLSSAFATPRTSADYAITADTIDFGGLQVASPDYAISSSVGPVVGISNEVNTALVIKHGYIGQLYDLIGYALGAENFYPAEMGTTQLLTLRTADDGSSVNIPSTGFTFTVLGGPISGISATGLVTAGTVYENTEAQVAATSPLFAGRIELLLYVQESLPDNFGAYGADGIADWWQVQHFGLDNPLAAPSLDPDGDTHNNLFEFAAGLNPTDTNSRFRFEISANQANSNKKITFSPVLQGHTYLLKSRLSLGTGPWQPLVSFTVEEAAGTRVITDLDASSGTKFYQLEVTRD